MFSILNFDIQQMNEQFCETDRHAFYSNQTNTLLINETEKLFFRSIIFILPFIYLSLSLFHALFHSHDFVLCLATVFFQDQYVTKTNRLFSKNNFDCQTSLHSTEFVHIHMLIAKFTAFSFHSNLPSTGRERKNHLLAGYWKEGGKNHAVPGARCFLLLLLIWLWWADIGELENMTFAFVQAICFRHNRIEKFDRNKSYSQLDKISALAAVWIRRVFPTNICAIKHYFREEARCSALDYLESLAKFSIMASLQPHHHSRWHPFGSKLFN